MTPQESLAVFLSKPAKRGVFRGIQYRFIGVDVDLITRCGRMERVLHSTLALAVLLTVSLACIYGTISSAILISGTTDIGPSNVVVGLFVGVAIYVLERVLLATFSRDSRATDEQAAAEEQSAKSRLTFVGLALFRLAVALMIATLVTEPILLLMHQDDIEVVLQARRDREATAEIEAASQEFDQELEDELPTSTAVELSQTRIEQLNGEITLLKAERETKKKEAKDNQDLATCEQNGAITPACAALRDPSDPPLSDAVGCEDLCQGYLENVAAANDRITEINNRLDAIATDELPQANSQKERSVEENVDSLEVEIGGKDANGKPYRAPSRVAARQECAVNVVKLRYKQISEDDPRLPHLFEYCEMNFEDVRSTPQAYSGLAARQEAFAVLLECTDPLGLRTTEVDDDEPRYCAIAGGKVAPPEPAASQTTAGAGSEASDEAAASEDGGDGDDTEPTSTATVEDADLEGQAFPDTSLTSMAGWQVRHLLPVGQSTISLGASRIALVILALDLLPLFLKLSMSLRSTRPYDAAVTLDKDFALAQVAAARRALDLDNLSDPLPPPDPDPDPPPDPPPGPGGPMTIRKFEPGDTLAVNQATYRMVKRLMSGGQGEIWQVELLTGGGALEKVKGAILVAKVALHRPNYTQEQIDRKVVAMANEAFLYRIFADQTTKFPRVHQISDDAIIMRFYPRLSLDVWVRQLPPITYGTLFAWHEDMFTALSVLWREQFVHGDGKPGNLLVTGGANGVSGLDDPDGALRVADLGGAVAKDNPGAVWTPSYSPIEQLRGDGLTPLADVFSYFGGVSYFLLSGGRRPWEDVMPPNISDGGPSALVPYLQTPPTSLRHWNPTVPPAVEAIVMQWLSPNPLARIDWRNSLVPPATNEIQRELQKQLNQLRHSATATDPIPMTPPSSGGQRGATTS